MSGNSGIRGRFPPSKNRREDRRSGGITYLFISLTLMLFAAALSGCVTLTDVETSQEHARDPLGVVGPDSSIGQTFTSRRPRLNGFSFTAGTVSPASNGSQSLLVELFHSPQDERPLFSTTVPVTTFSQVTVGLPPQPDPPGQSYYIHLTSQSGEVRIFGRSEDIYPYGQAYANREPLQADISFRAAYDYNLGAMLEDLLAGLPRIWLALPLTLTLLIPGWLLLDLLGLRQAFDGGEQAALAVALSLSLIPLVMLWTSTLGLQWNRSGVLAAAGLASIAAYWRLVRRPISFKISHSGLALAAVFIASLGFRFAMARDLQAPAWVDSVHHALITRLVMDNGAFPASYAPYLGIDPTQYHAGFHSGLAVFTWLSGLDLPEAMLVYGQTLNALAVVGVYLLGVSLTKSRTAGILAALIAGLVTPMPAYYASWGRYTHLAGLLILPAILAFARHMMDEERNLSNKFRLNAALAACLVVAGLLLVHYRVAAFAACLLIAYVISLARFNREKLPGLAQRAGLSASLLLLVPFLLTLPWMAPTFTRHILPVLSLDQARHTPLFGDFSWRYLTAGLGTYAMGLAGLGLIWGLFRRPRFSTAMLLWVVLLFFLSNLGALGLPGAGFVNNSSVVITLFAPISLLAGYFAAEILSTSPKFLPEVYRKPLQWSLLAGLLVLNILGARQLLSILNPATEIFRAADRPALAWIDQHVPEQETILINPFNWGYGIYAGYDGGFWIAPLAGRPTMPPAILYGAGPIEEVQQIIAFSQEVIDRGDDPQALWDLMHANDIRYVYLGARGGAISPKALSSNPLFETLYEADGAYLFQTRPVLEDLP